MTAILLDSIRIGSTSWFATRRGNGLEVQGMEEGDRLLVSFQPDASLSVEEDGIFRLPDGVEMVSVEHVEAATRENGGVCVDLVKRKVWAS